MPVALPPPLPLPDGLPSRVEQYGPSGHLPLAPPEFWSAFETGCGWLGSPEVPALPLLWSDEPPDAVPELVVASALRLALPLSWPLALPFVWPLALPFAWPASVGIAVAAAVTAAWPPGAAMAAPVPIVIHATTTAGSRAAVRSLPRVPLGSLR